MQENTEKTENGPGFETVMEALENKVLQVIEKMQRLNDENAQLKAENEQMAQELEAHKALAARLDGLAEMLGDAAGTVLEMVPEPCTIGPGGTFVVGEDAQAVLDIEEQGPEIGGLASDLPGVNWEATEAAQAEIETLNDQESQGQAGGDNHTPGTPAGWP